MFRFFKGELSPGKLVYLSAGIFIGSGAVITNWTHIVYFNPLMFFCGLLLVAINWRTK